MSVFLFAWYFFFFFFACDFIFDNSRRFAGVDFETSVFKEGDGDGNCSLGRGPEPPETAS